MIYLIREKFVNIDTGKLVDLLKIGYTDDNNFNDRMSQYRLHCPGFKLLLTINECDDKIEKALHRYFREYLYDDYGKEWFNYNERIIDFFNKYNTKELLEEKLKHIINHISLTPQDDVELYRTIKKVVNRWLCLISNDINSLKDNSRKIKQIISDCKNNIRKFIYSKEDIITYLVKQYNISENIERDLLDYISGNKFNKLSDKVKKFLDEFSDNKLFKKKMKLLCTTDLTKEERSTIINLLSLDFKRYYETLGPDRLYALGYNITNIEREYQATLFSKEDLKQEIYSNYKEGQRYSKSYIKDSLQKLYDNLNYTKKAKANDIEEYFKVKECNVSNTETGKYDKGFELIKKRD